MYPCTKCNKAYKHRQHLYRHKLICKSNKAFKCIACGKEFKRKDSLKRHLTICRMKDKKCKVCNKDFNYPSQLQRHMPSHFKSHTTKRRTTATTATTAHGPVSMPKDMNGLIDICLINTYFQEDSNETEVNTTFIVIINPKSRLSCLITISNAALI